MVVQAGDVIKAQDINNLEFNYLKSNLFSNQLVTSTASFTPTKQYTITALISLLGYVTVTRNNLSLNVKHDINEGFTSIIIDENDTVSVSSGYAILSLGV